MYCIYMLYAYMLVELVSAQQCQHRNKLVMIDN